MTAYNSEKHSVNHMKMNPTENTTSLSRKHKTITMVGCFRVLLILSFGEVNGIETVNFHFMKGLDDKIYSQPGDINIGAMVFVLEESLSHHAEKCSEEVKLSTYELENTETIAFAVDLINRNPHILPNISLGYVIRGICQSSGVILGTSFSFLPQSKRTCNNSTCSMDVDRSSETSWISHDVIGLVGVGWSTFTVPISSLYAVGHLPIIGPKETSDDLSNKRDHPYFFRIVPPDSYQVQAMLRFIASKGWSYISVIYEDGNYGQRAYDRILRNVGRYGICVATSHRLIHPPKYSNIVSDLLLNYRARVVIAFVWPHLFRELLQAVVDKNATKHFIWIGSDSLVSYPGYDYKGIDHDPAIGTLAFDFHTTYVPDFFHYLQRQRISSTTNPWLKPMWQYLFDCSHDEGTCDPNANMLQSAKYKTFKETSLRMDAVLTLARAAHDLLSTRCPKARGQEARDCITGEMLREHLKNISFEGFTGRIKFDENQDVKGKYIISQFVYDYFKTPYKSNMTNSDKIIFKREFGVYDISTDTFIYFNKSVSWSHLSTVDHVENWTEDFAQNEVPQSSCSFPCGVGEYKIEKELSCCWECRKCRENERLVKDNTTCETCPSFMWPDPASGLTTCIDIPLTYPLFKDVIPIVFISLALFGLVITVMVIISYAIYCNERVIKASSRELSAIQLFAIFIGYATVIFFQIKPSDVMCSTIFFLFCMSFVLLYSPLLVKTARIYRIFRHGNKTLRPRFISTHSQLVFANCLIVVQAALCITVYIFYWPKSKRTQPIWSEKLVELSCDLTFPGIASFLGYNIVLVSLCSVVAFMVRGLPDNFNESKFISMCVSTTLLIWLVFIPAYFTANREFIRVFLLSMGLYLNHSVALIFLFVPKIYAAKFLPPESGDFSKNRA